ncbi:hypothetical protein [Pseudanabaena sp. 'Roaring Creek']|uniref:hypothetical protein n=1 Tax=Pseudanabaena sp. 'Roaring Creek' TaxID=1681830 RepID=UPI0006D8181A|nr:hypothetical protein [Pseudanabaena sp. 'Roaring Creek']
MRLRFYFEYKPTNGSLTNYVCIESGEFFRSVRTSSIIGINLRQSWMTDEICDRVGKQLASDRQTWGQFVCA